MLRHLHWCENIDFDDYEEHEAEIGSFFAKLPAAQVHLHLDRFDASWHSIAIRLSTILDNVPRLRQLTLKGSYFRGNILDEVVKLMKVARQKHQPILPDLQVFTLTTGDNGRDILLFLMNLIKERRASGAAGLRIDVPRCSKALEWSSGARSWLKTMVNEGFNLEIYENGERVTWLT
jgi:hypothetical protein